MKFFSECGRTIPGVTKGSKMMRLYVDDTPDKSVGQCFFFVLCENDNPVNVKAIHEVFFHMFEKPKCFKSYFVSLFVTLLSYN